MYNFREYIDRRDESSFNPLHKIGDTGRWGDIEDAAAVVGHIPVAAASLIPAALSGMGAMPDQYRKMRYGNPFKSDTDAKTRHIALTAFERNRDWLLNYTEKQPKIANWLISILEQVEKYFQTQQQTNIAGVYMGQQPTTIGGVLALGGSFFKGITTSLRNVFDTINPVHEIPPNETLINGYTTKVLQALDALQSVDKAAAINKLEEFLHVLERGGNAKHIDSDARYR